jgi:hypothetical protein
MTEASEVTAARSAISALQVQRRKLLAEMATLSKRIDDLDAANARAKYAIATGRSAA